MLDICLHKLELFNGKNKNSDIKNHLVFNYLYISVPLNKIYKRRN